MVGPLSIALILLFACGGATQEPIGSSYPDVRLQVTYQHPDIDPATYLVTCQENEARVEGADLDADAACATLSDLSVISRLVDGPPADQACPEIYGGPDTATIEGTIDGADVNTVVDRSNGCGISDWDNLLDTLLPPPIGVEDSA